jgi:primosomal protein N''
MKHEYLRLNQKLEKLTAKMKNTSNSQSHPHKFYPRIVNNTNTELTTEEKELLSKGLQYNIN